MERTKMIMVTETSEFMMAYVILTEKGNAIVVDGGRPEDLPLLKEAIGGRPIQAWFLTHPHLDHITAFNDVVRRQDPDFDIRAVYCHFPSQEYADRCEPDEAWTLREFNEVRPLLGDRLHDVRRGDVICVDEVTIRVLYHWEESFSFVRETINDTSIVFRLETPRTSVLFLGDLGPEGGDKLLEQSRRELKSEYCQMAHHGHMCVGPDVYIEVDPRVCLWNAPGWLWEESDRHINYRMYGQGMTRRWMERLGITDHRVTKDGTQEILL